MPRPIRRLGALAAAIALTGAGLLAATGSAAVAATPTVFDLNGVYLGGTERVVVTNSNDVITVDMSAVRRPTATGVVVNSDTIFVSFPDAGSFTGKLAAPGTIRWSNSTEWVKAVRIPNVIGQSDVQAPRTLRAAGFVAVLGGGSVDCNAIGQVTRTSPGAGTFARPGATVRYFLGEAPQPPADCN
jgi:hypothetical protein